MISEHHKNKKARVIQDVFKKYKKVEKDEAEGKVKKLFNTFKENAVMSELLKPLPADHKNKNTATKTEIEFHTEPVMEEAPIKVLKEKLQQEQREKQPENPKESRRKKVYQVG